MKNEEIYLTCICGAIVKDTDVSQHVDDCLKEEFMKNSVTLKIRNQCRQSHTHTKERHVCAKCIRCGHSMLKHEGTLITFYPSMNKPFVSCCNYRYKCQNKNVTKDLVCETCHLPTDFHQEDKESEVINCADNIERDKSISIDIEQKLRKQRVNIMQFLENDPENAFGVQELHEHEHSVIHSETPIGPPCKMFHVAILPNYTSVCKENSKYQNYSLLLQILDHSPSTVSANIQTDVKCKVDVGHQVKILGVYPEGIEEKVPAGQGTSLPSYDAAADAAFRSHLQSLIPCGHCSRTFSPDRIMKHESCCIERPKSRQCITPPDGKIGR